MTANQAPAPVRRPDAARNRDKILTAARTAFTDPRAEVSMAEIARRAGVGMATLYRNFPGRRELLEALFADEVDAICAAAEAVSGETPGAALTDWLHRFFTFVTSKRPISAELLKHADDDDPVFDTNRNRVITAGKPLFTAAKKAGEIRADVTFEQTLDMLIAIAGIHRNGRYVKPILKTALDGLRTRPS
jgi:AcrR family transcriptional regulator